MARINNYSYKNFQPRKPNHSFLNSEKLHLTGNSVSANNIWTIQPVKHDATCPTTKFEASTVNTEKLSLNESRRPFFDDQYSWLRTTNFDPSAVSLAKYIGSGTLAADETSATTQFFWSFIPGIDNSNLSVMNDYDNLHYYLSSWFYEYEDKMYGNKIVNWNKNKLALSKNVNGAVDYWTYKFDENDDDKDAVVVVLDGWGWGKQAFTDLTMTEGLRGFLDLAATSLGYQASDIVFNPPLPYTYHNPIATMGLQPIKNLYGLPQATELWSEYYFTHTNLQSIPLYTKDYADDQGKYHVLQSCWPAEFVGVVNGGDVLSSIFPQFWDPVTGFQETVVNVVERGVTPFIGVFTYGNLIFQHLTLNEGGEGVHKVELAIYNNHEWNQSQYYNYDASVTVGPITVPIAPSALLVNLFGNQGFFTHGWGPLFWLDHRFNKLHLYSPENKKLVTVNGLTATSATLSNGTTVSSNAVLSSVATDGLEVQAVIALDVTSQNNYINYNMYNPSGADPKVKYFKQVRYGDPEYLDSNKLCIIYERENCGDLRDAAVGHFAVLNTSAENVLYGHRGPNILAGALVNYMSSGTRVSAYQDAWSRVYGEDGAANNLEKLRNTFLGGCVTNVRIGNYYMPSGWTATEAFCIVGTSKEDVIQKLDAFLETYDAPMFVNAKGIVPEPLYSYGVPFKAGKVF